MRAKRTHHANEPPLFQRCRLKLSAELPITVKVLIGQGAIDDTTLAFSYDKNFWLEIYSKERYPSQEKIITDWFKAYAESNPIGTEDLRLNFIPIAPFTSKALFAISQVPFGRTQTYKDIATTIGNPQAMRAIGCACHHNPFPLIIPCHRIVMQDGVGGFAYTQKMKELLLDFEGRS